MSPGEWVEIVRLIQANWPQQRIPRASLAKWYDDLHDLPAETVAAAVESIYRQGREWPPNGALILREVADQTVAAPEFGVAWAQILQAIRSYGCHNQQRVLDALENPAVKELASLTSIRDIGMAPDGDTTLHAQARERYRSIVTRHHHKITHAGLPSAATTGELRGEGRPAPRQIGAAMAELVEGLQP